MCVCVCDGVQSEASQPHSSVQNCRRSVALDLQHETPGAQDPTEPEDHAPPLRRPSTAVGAASPEALSRWLPGASRTYTQCRTDGVTHTRTHIHTHFLPVLSGK